MQTLHVPWNFATNFFCNLFKNCALPDKQDIKLHGTCIRSGAEKVSLGCFRRIQDRGPLSIEVAAASGILQITELLLT